MNLRMRTIALQVFVLFLSSMLLLLIVLGTIFYHRTTDSIRQKVGQIAEQNVSQGSENFDVLLGGYDSLSKTIMGNPDVQRVLSKVTIDPYSSRVDERTVLTALYSILYSREDIAGIYIIPREGSVYSVGSESQAIDPTLWSENWYQNISVSNGKMVWIGLQPHSVIDGLQNQPVFSFGRKIYNLSTQQLIGILLIEMNPSPITSTLHNLRVGDGGEAVLLNEDMELLALSSTDRNPMPRWLKLPAQEEQLMELEQEGFLVKKNQSRVTDLTVVSMTPNSELDLEMKETRRFLLIVIGILVGISIPLALLFSRSISAPLKKLVGEMRRMERGSLESSLQVNSYAEVNYLVAAFHQMIHRIHHLMERNRIITASEKEAELKALQSQVNPHFLYNTLDMIYWMLDESDNERVGNIILSLSYMFRYSSNWKNAMDVTLQEELEHLNHYLVIIRARTGDRLRFDQEVPEEWMGVKVPKMILQPLVENAVVHGLSPTGMEGRILIRARGGRDMLTITIEDSGQGIPAQQLSRIQETLKSVHTTASRGHVGLLNVQQRLVYKYGSEYGIQLTSVWKEGTTVAMTIPITPESATAKEGGAA